ncbi:MAG TPA: dihydroorotate dehydrogenase [Candidatus Methylomirabilis sp.]|nr:dihydroorotate dehydrogenase [Candidatus Methylomirabilis sp.]
MKNRTYYEAAVISSAAVSDESEIFDFVLRAGSLDKSIISPGQFFSFRPQNDKAWPRPFSLAEIDENGCLRFFIRAVGDFDSNTRLYTQMQPGTPLEIFGPFGKKFELLSGIKNYLFVGGGMGAAGLFPIAKMVLASGKKVEFFFGAKFEYDIFGEEIFKRLGILPQIVVENPPSHYDHGRATDLLASALYENKSNTAVIACGPKKMLEKVYQLCKWRHIPCLVMVEELMACNTGACKGCAIKGVDGKYQQVCTDGPLFDAYWIDWPAYLREPEIRDKSEKPVKISLEDPLVTILGGQDDRLLRFGVPISNGSGCLNENGASNLSGILTAYFTKTVTLKERLGNPMPRICETSRGGMLNSIGLANVGVERFKKEKLPLLQKLGMQIIVSIAGDTSMEFGEIVDILDGEDFAGYEINVSCPNVSAGGVAFGIEPDATSRVVKTVRLKTKKFLIVKLTPMASDIVSVAKAAESAGADSLSIANTFEGMVIDIETLRPKIGRNCGGYSGPPIMPINLAKLCRVYQSKPKIPLIGEGGIITAQDALQYFIGGASAVCVGTGSFANRHIFSDVKNGILEHLQRHGIAHINQLIGALKYW